MEKAKEAITVLKGARLIDGNGGPVLRKAVVVIDGAHIKAIGPEGKIPVPKEAAVIDMKSCTLMPGLMDIHLHCSAHNPISFKNYRISQLEVTPPLQMLYTLLHQQIMLEMGFTTLRDNPWPNAYGGHNSTELVALRDAVEAGIFAGPRLVVGGYATMTGSHLDLIMPRGCRREPDATADGPWELRKLARKQLRIGVDFIKTCASGGGGTDKEAPDVRNMTQEELSAVVDEAHALDKHCACHCFTPTAQKMAIKAGADTIDHCVFTDDEAIEMLVSEKKFIVPTLLHRSDRALEVRRRIGTSEFTLKKMKMLQEHTKQTFQRYLKAGVRIAMGTDMALDPEMGANAQELEIYVDYGMTPMEAIQTATKNTAEAIWLGKVTGTLEAGKYADIIAVDGDPLKDIRILKDKEKIKVVMKEGKIFVDRRPGHKKLVIHDEAWNWKRI
ncbi:MAG: amidohydrolase family protein [Proteobacteria bacterium]|nr:amidohydrolase family protein [Pseudomonadota bacterium]